MPVVVEQETAEVQQPYQELVKPWRAGMAKIGRALDERSYQLRQREREQRALEAVAAEINTTSMNATEMALQILSKTAHLGMSASIDLVAKRTGETVIADGEATGCTDRANAFMAIAGRVNLKATYVQTVAQDSMENPSGKLLSHALARIQTGQGDILADPTTGWIERDGVWTDEQGRTHGEVYDEHGRINKPRQNGVYKFHVICEGRNSRDVGFGRNPDESMREWTARIRLRAGEYWGQNRERFV